MHPDPPDANKSTGDESRPQRGGLGLRRFTERSGFPWQDHGLGMSTPSLRGSDQGQREV